MPRHGIRSRSEETHDYLITVGDLMAGLVFVFIITLMLFAFRFQREIEREERVVVGVVGNHRDLQDLAAFYSKPFHHILEYPDAVINGQNEEHGHVDLSACTDKPEVGEVVAVEASGVDGGEEDGDAADGDVDGEQEQDEDGVREVAEERDERRVEAAQLECPADRRTQPARDPPPHHEDEDRADHFESELGDQANDGVGASEIDLGHRLLH
jgi:hypothetical protein